MGQVNCRCEAVSVNGVNTSLQSLADACRDKPKQQSHKKTRSRVNSIISPRQLVGMHSRQNSASNLANKDSRQALEEGTGKFMSQHVVGLQQCVKSQNRRFLLQFWYEGKKYQMELGHQIIRFGVVTAESGLYDQLAITDKEYKIFSLCARFNKMNSQLGIKDNKLGLGIFEYFKEGDTVYVSIGGESNQFQVILDIGVGTFMVITLFKYKYKYSLECSIIKKGTIETHQAVSKSLPSLYQSIENNSNNQHIVITSRHIINDKQTKILENKVKIILNNTTISIKSVNSQGFYRYLSDYVVLYDGMLLRCGVQLYDVSIRHNRDMVYIINSI